jgi:PAS domain S-box-containing protein
MSYHRLLIVEDEAIVALDMKDRLAGMGYHLVGHATTGELALKLTRELRPDLVLMDIRLQGDMDGIVAAQEIRRRFHLPVIFLTAYAEDETLERAKLAEPYGYILKPFDDRELKSAIEIALYKHRAEEEIRRLNRLYDVLSQVNQTLVRVQSREELLGELCQVLVERGDVDLAWIGWLDPDTAQLIPVAQAGDDRGLLTQATFSADGRPEGQGNPGKAVRSGKASVCNSCDTDPCLFPEAHAPRRFGFQSCGTFPLRFQGRVCAVLNLCLADPEFFGDREIELLQEVALDVSFALDKLEAEVQRKAAEQALRESEDQFRAIFELASVGMAQADPRTGRFQRVNQKLCAITGYTADELLGMSFTEITHPEDRSRDWEAFQRVVRGEAPAYHNEKRYIKKDGTVIWVNINVALHNDSAGRPLYSLAVIEDITARRQAEEALQHSERLFRQMTETVDEVFWLSSPDFQSILYISPAFEKVWGWTCAELYEQPMLWLEAVHPEDYPQVLSALKVMAQGQAYNVEYRISHPDGSLRWINDRGYPLLDEAGEVILTSGVASDVTARKQAENALRASEEKFRLAMEAIQEGVWDWYIPTGELYISPGFIRSFGYDPEEVEHTISHWEAAIHPEDLPRYQELL